MTYEFEYLMHLLRSASVGLPAEPPEKKLDWNRAFSLASEQMIKPLIGYALKENPSIGYPEDRAKIFIKESFSAILTESARRSAVIALLGELEKSGVHNFTVKGFAVASEYFLPEARISSDTDICISPEDEEKAMAFFESRGFKVEERWRNGHHFSACHPVMGLIEVHIQLYDEIVEDVWFADADADSLVCQPHKKIHTDDGDYYTLGDTDHLIFMVLHMTKHFITCGMSLRMMADIALFIAAKKDELDFGRLRSVLEKLNYYEFFLTVIRAAELCFNFDDLCFADSARIESQKVETVLTDLEKGGWLGKNNSVERNDGWREYSRLLMLRRKSKLGYWLYMFRWQNEFGLKALFPPKKRLAGAYPCLNRFPWLLPFVWLHRILFKGFKKGKETKEKIVFNENDISEESKRRVEMFRSLGML